MRCVTPLYPIPTEDGSALNYTYCDGPDLVDVANTRRGGGGIERTAGHLACVNGTFGPENLGGGEIASQG